MRQFFRVVSVVVGLTVFGDLAHAHHSQAGIFDSKKTIEVTGVVKSVSWRNPHGQILLSVRDEKGVETIWDAETASVSILRNRGVDGSPIRVGDRVTIAGSPSMRARPEILARSALLPNGNEFTFGSANPYFAAGKAGRLVGGVKIAGDVAAAKAKADGLFRVWSTIMSDPAAFPMFKGGYPLTAAGKAGLAKWNPRNNILLKCGTKGTPLIMISPLPMDFSRQGDTIIMRLEEYDSVRTIHMNPKAVAPAAHTLFGFSRGRWEGTTLVVETDHIAAGYFDHEGTPQSDQIKTVERFIPTRITAVSTTPDDNGSRQLHEALRPQGSWCGSLRTGSTRMNASIASSPASDGLPSEAASEASALRRMKGRQMTRVTHAVFVATLLTVPVLIERAFAHHGAGRYDPRQNMELEGKLTRIDFVNPHSYVYFDVVGADGKVIAMKCETRGATVLRRRAGRRRCS